MKILIVHGQSHEGATCHIARQLAEKIGGTVTEFFLPRDFCSLCCGCGVCILQDEHRCPHYADLAPLSRAMQEADVLILASPVYVYHVTGAMKAWLDHYGYQWMVHRPDASMFRKQAVCIATAAGAGMKSTMQDMADSLFYWGVPKVYRCGFAVHAMGWNHVKPALREKIDRRTDEIAAEINRCHGKVKPPLKTRMLFRVMRKVQRSKMRNPPDHAYWKAQGWLDGKKPW